MTKKQMIQIETALKGMKPSELIMHMVAGLKKEWHPVNMDTYARVEGYKKPVCYGCAATNAIANIVEKPIFTTRLQSDRIIDFIYEHHEDIFGAVEEALNQLRQGEFFRYNSILTNRVDGLVDNLLIPKKLLPALDLPCLDNYDYKDWLQEYEDYAEFLKTKGY